MKKGRSSTLIEKRNDALWGRWIYWTETKRLRFDDAGKAMQLRPFWPGKIVPLGHNTVDPFGPNSINQLYPKVCQRFFV